MAQLDKPQLLLSFLAVHPETVNLPGGGSVLVRRWTAAERQEFQREHKAAGGAKLLERLFVRSVCDESGKLLFAPADLDAVSDLDGRAVEAVALKSLELNGLGEDTADPSTAIRN